MFEISVGSPGRVSNLLLIQAGGFEGSSEADNVSPARMSLSTLLNLGRWLPFDASLSIRPGTLQ